MDEFTFSNRFYDNKKPSLYAVERDLPDIFTLCSIICPQALRPIH